MRPRDSNTSSILLDHPLIQSYLKINKIKTFDEKTKFPMGLLTTVYQDYTGTKISFNNNKIKSSDMIAFGRFFSPSLYSYV